MRRALLLVVLVLAAACSKSPKKEPAPPVPLEASSAVPLASAAAKGDGGHARRDGGHGRRNGHEDHRDEAVADAGALKLDAKIGGALSTWHKAAFDKVPRFTLGSDSEGRDVWSLRELARTLVGPNARVVAIYGRRETLRLEPSVWNDATRTPILHTTRRGTLKFRWADKDGTWDDAELSDITLLEIER